MEELIMQKLKEHYDEIVDYDWLQQLDWTENQTTNASKIEFLMNVIQEYLQKYFEKQGYIVTPQNIKFVLIKNESKEPTLKIDFYFPIN